jgi:hypothetical protein
MGVWEKARERSGDVAGSEGRGRGAAPLPSHCPESTTKPTFHLPPLPAHPETGAMGQTGWLEEGQHLDLHLDLIQVLDAEASVGAAWDLAARCRSPRARRQRSRSIMHVACSRERSACQGCQI